MGNKELQGTKVLMVIAPEQFRDEELLVPKEEFEGAGATVQVAASKLGPAQGMLGATYNPEVLLKDQRAQDWDAVVVVGGMGSPQYLWNDADLLRLLKDAYAQGNVVSAICLSGAALANAGVLKGKQATVWPMPESLKALADGGANYVKKPVVHDGKVITADGPEAASSFAQTIIAELSRVKVPTT